MPHPNAKLPPLARFLMKCQFDPCTGCVNWTGSTSMGRGKNSPYGTFWFEGRRVYAHRWALEFIHCEQLEDWQHVEHICGNTLCQLHLKAIPPLENTRLYWIRVEVGLEQYRAQHDIPVSDVPFYSPPPWLAQQNAQNFSENDCPF